MNKKDSTQKATKPKKTPRPTDRILSESRQAAKKANATTGLVSPERHLDDYLAEVSERTDVRVGVPLPLGTY